MAEPPNRLGARLLAEARLFRWERRLAAAVKRALDAHRVRVLASLRSTVAAAPPVDPFDSGVWLDTLGAELTPVAHQVFAEMGESTLEAFYDDPAAYPPVDLTHHMDRMVGHMAGLGPDMATRLGTTLGEGFNRGESLYDLDARVQDTFGVGARRAETIARTETVGAANGVSHDVARSLIDGGLELDKEWLATGDHRTRPSHARADGQVRPFDQPFEVGGCLLQRPHDPEAFCPSEIVNCRCVLMYPEAEPPAAVATSVARDRAYKAITPYRRQLKAEAAKVGQQALDTLERADVPRLARPPARRLHVDPISGTREYRRGTGGEWDWFDQLAPPEQTRLRRWMVDNDVDAPDQIAQRWTANFGGSGEVDDVMAAWVDLTRTVDGSRALSAGRLPSRAAYGDLNPDDLAPDFAQRFSVEAVYGEMEDAAAYVARVRAGEAVEAIERAFTPAVLGPHPWEMTEEQWVADLYATQDRVLAGKVVGSDEWGPTYTEDAEQALRRLAELVPRGFDPWGPEADTTYGAIVELAVRAGLVGGA